MSRSFQRRQPVQRVSCMSYQRKLVLRQRVSYMSCY